MKIKKKKKNVWDIFRHIGHYSSTQLIKNTYYVTRYGNK
jgi:hypothetical protein